MPENRLFNSETASPAEVASAAGDGARSTGRVALLCVCAAVVVGALVFWLTTPYGAGISPDSVMYVGGARGIALGHGFSQPSHSTGEFRPVVSYPPLYSALLSLGAVGGDGQAVDILRFGWLVQMVLHAMLVILGAWLTWWALRRPAEAPGLAVVLPTVCVALLFATGGTVLRSLSMVWSEGLFIVLMLGSLGLIAADARWPHWGWLATAAVLAGMAYLTRYAGLSLIAYGGLAAAVLRLRGLRDLSWARRLAESALRGGAFLAIAGAAVGLWILRNTQIGAANLLGRQLDWHPPGDIHWEAARVAMQCWVWPQAPKGAEPRTATVLAIFGIAALLGFVASTLINRLGRTRPIAQDRDLTPPASRPPLAGVLAGFSALYGAFLITSITLFDIVTYPDHRILLPAYVCLVIAVMIWAGRVANLPAWTRSPAGRRFAGPARFVAMTLLLALVMNTAYSGASNLVQSRRHGLGWASPHWRFSPLLQAVAALPEGTLIVSNGADVIAFLTGRPASFVFHSRDVADPARRRPAPDFEARMQLLHRYMRERGAVLVLFSRMPDRWSTLREEEAIAHLPLRLVRRHEDGAIYTLDEPPVHEPSSAPSPAIAPGPVQKNLNRTTR